MPECEVDGPFRQALCPAFWARPRRAVVFPSRVRRPVPVDGVGRPSPSIRPLDTPLRGYSERTGQEQNPFAPSSGACPHIEGPDRPVAAIDAPDTAAARCEQLLTAFGTSAVRAGGRSSLQSRHSRESGWGSGIAGRQASPGVAGSCRRRHSSHWRRRCCTPRTRWTPSASLLPARPSRPQTSRGRSSGFCDDGDGVHHISPRDVVYIVHDKAGASWKLRILDYYSDIGSGNFTLEYAPVSGR